MKITFKCENYYLLNISTHIIFDLAFIRYIFEFIKEYYLLMQMFNRPIFFGQKI